MGAKRKFKDDYPEDSKKEKAEIKAYLDKISKLLEDPENQKKAAEILSQLINNKKK